MEASTIDVHGSDVVDVSGDVADDTSGLDVTNDTGPMGDVGAPDGDDPDQPIDDAPALDANIVGDATDAFVMVDNPAVDIPDVDVSSTDALAVDAALVCPSGFGDCDGDRANGCETALATDPAHCGACTTACATVVNASATCTSSECGFTCRAGFSNCDANPTNGCETDIDSDNANCGTCGNVCSPLSGGPSCSGGVCSISCPAGFADCSPSVPGCETNVTNDPSHCGNCSRVCPSPRTCTAGACS